MQAAEGTLPPLSPPQNSNALGKSKKQRKGAWQPVWVEGEANEVHPISSHMMPDLLRCGIESQTLNDKDEAEAGSGRREGMQWNGLERSRLAYVNACMQVKSILILCMRAK